MFVREILTCVSTSSTHIYIYIIKERASTSPTVDPFH